MGYIATKGRYGSLGPRGRRQALGDVFCLEGDCAAGELLVNEMITFFDNVGPRMPFSANPVTFRENILAGARAATPTQKAFWAKFGTAYLEIVSEYFRLETETTFLGTKKKNNPLSITCCTIKELGRKAQLLEQQGHSFLGTQAPATTFVKDPFDPSNGLFGNALSGVMGIVKLGLFAIIGLTVYNAVKQKG